MKLVDMALNEDHDTEMVMEPPYQNFSGHVKPYKVTTQLEKILLLVIAIVVAVGIGLSIAVAKLNSDRGNNLESLSNNETNVCYTPTCINEASNLMKSIDPSVDPCEDFYSFACGNWVKNAHLITTSDSQFTRLSANILLRAKDILENLEKETDIPVHKKKIADFYKACMNKTVRNTLGPQELLSDLQKFGNWPLIDDGWDPSTFDWVELMVKLHRNGYRSNQLFDVAVDMDPEDTSRSLIKIGQPSLGLIKPKYYDFTYKEMIKSYKEVLFKLAELLKSDLDKDKSIEAIHAAFKIENQLAHAIKSIYSMHPKKPFIIMTLQEIENFAPEIPWRKILRELLPNGTKLEDSERIHVAVPSAIQGLNDILRASQNNDGKRALANYMFYRTVFQAAEHLSSEYYHLVNNLFEQITPITLKLWEICLTATTSYFPHSLASCYVEKYLDTETQNLVDMMVKDMSNVLEDAIEDSFWIDGETTDYAKLKVKKMKQTIAYPDEIMNTTILNDFYKSITISDNHFSNMRNVGLFKQRRKMEGLRDVRTRSRWSEITNLLTANAYYYQTQNSIVVPVGVLQDPFFASNRPNYINYGGLGTIVGHELNHAFDPVGSLFGADGSYRLWWSSKSWKKFVEKVKCYQEQYNNYYDPDSKTNVNGTMTIEENMADNGGLRTAYYAYYRLLRRNGLEKSLPGLSYSNRQMFWISYASVWCRKETEDSVVSGMKNSAHTISKFRVIGSLSNLDEFSEDFKCKFNSKMNPKNKCSLW